MKTLTRFLVLLAIFSAISCKKKHEEEPPAPYASFKVGSIDKTYKHASNFSKDFCSSSTFCCQFRASNDTSSKEELKFGIPGDPIVGHVYYSGLYRFSCFYIDPAGTRYDLTSSGSSLFSVTFTQWAGQGGWGKGYFSGWMKSANNDSILFQNGYFQNKIWTMGTE